MVEPMHIADDLDGPEEPNEDVYDRASERRSFFLKAVLSVAEQGTVQARVRNLSAGGMMVELNQAPDPEWAPGDRLSAELRNIGIVKGEIAWAGGRRFGVRFDREIDPELARKAPTGPKDVTPDFLRPILVPSRSLKKVGIQPRR
jgi:hypothetical protein